MISLNMQPREHREVREDGKLEVHSIFPTVQGEGPLVGTPAVFVRLAGCNLTCPGCDTDYTSVRKVMSVEEVLGEVNRVKPGTPNRGDFDRPLVVITGGEPFRQDIASLVTELCWHLYWVQIETNGTMFDDDFSDSDGGVTVVCSPKTPKVNLKLAPWIDSYKYVLRAGEVDASDGLPTRALMGQSPARPHPGFEGDIFLSPMDEQDSARNEANVKACTESCMKYGYRLSLQTHKLLGLP